MLQQLSERLEQYQNSGEEDFPLLDAPRESQVGELNPPAYQETYSDTGGDGENMAQDQQDPWFSDVDAKLEELDAFTKNLQEQISQSHLNVSAKVEEILRRESILTQEQFATLHQEAQTGFLTALSGLEKVQGQDAVVHVARQALETAGGATAKLKQLLNCELVDFEKEILQRVEQIESKFEDKINTKLGQVTQGWALQFAQERAEVDKKIISHGQIVTREIKKTEGQIQDLQRQVQQIGADFQQGQRLNVEKFQQVANITTRLGSISIGKLPASSPVLMDMDLPQSGFLVQPPLLQVCQGPKDQKMCMFLQLWLVISTPLCKHSISVPICKSWKKKMCNR